MCYPDIMNYVRRVCGVTVFFLGVVGVMGSVSSTDRFITRKDICLEKYTSSFWEALPLRAEIPFPEEKQAFSFYDRKRKEYMFFYGNKDWKRAFQACVSLADIGYDEYQAKTSFLLANKSIDVDVQIIGMKYLIASFYYSDPYDMRWVVLSEASKKILLTQPDKKSIIFSDEFARKLLKPYYREFPIRQR